MDIFQISDSQVVLTQDATVGVPANGFLWIDVTHDEVAADPEAWRDAVARISNFDSSMQRAAARSMRHGADCSTTSASPTARCTAAARRHRRKN